ncbi:MAG: alpha/beta hydrolase [Candidatus Helarchaeota archaeon]
MNKKYLILIISVGLILGGFIPMLYMSHYNEYYDIHDVTLYSEKDGMRLAAWLYIPNPQPSSTDPVPGVVVCHGFASSKIAMQRYSMECARRGFVVLTFDFRGHGNSDGYLDALRYTNESPLIEDCHTAINYLRGLNFVDNGRIALIGHSMGGATTLQVSATYHTEINASVVIGAIIQGRMETINYINISDISNLMLGLGERDEIFSVDVGLQFLANITGGIATQINTQYGNFTFGNATKLVIAPNTDHMGEIFDKILIQNTIIWLESAFYGGVRYPISLSIPQYDFFMIIAFMGLSMGFFPVISLTRDLLFKKIPLGNEKEKLLPHYNFKIATTQHERYQSILFYSLFYIGGITLGLVLQIPLDILFESAIPKVMSDIFLGLFMGLAIGLFVMWILLQKFVEKDNTPLTRAIFNRVRRDFRKLSFSAVIFALYTIIILGLFISSSFYDLLPDIRGIGTIIAIFPFIFLYTLMDEMILRQLQDKLNIKSTIKELGAVIAIGVGLKFVFFLPTIFLVTGLTLIFIEPVLVVIPLMQALSTWMYINSRRNSIVPALITCFMLSWMISSLMPYGTMYFPLF